VPNVPVNLGESSLPLTASALYSCSALGLAMENAGIDSAEMNVEEGLVSVTTAVPASGASHLAYRLFGPLGSSFLAKPPKTVVQ
jgi:hypothetical protein